MEPTVSEGHVDFRGYRTWYRRSEEHTSELQSQSNLVCRLLLEKKKKIFDNLFDDFDRDVCITNELIHTIEFNPVKIAFGVTIDNGACPDTFVVADVTSTNFDYS